MKTITTLTAIASLITLTSFAQMDPEQELLISVTYNSNLMTQVPKSHIIEFSNEGMDNLDSLDFGDESSVGGRNTINDSVYSGNHDYVYPFSISGNNTIVTIEDSRPELNGYKAINIGFATSIPATIDFVVDTFFTPTYNFSGTNLTINKVYLECISTGQIFEVLNNTVTLNIPANPTFLSDYILHIMPKVIVSTTPASCFGFNDGSILIHNPLCTNWNSTIYLNGNTIFSATVSNPDTTIPNLVENFYDVVVYINGLLADSEKVHVNSPEEIIPFFTSLYGNSFNINDNALFINQSTGANSYTWSFGDSTTDTLVNPMHTYSTAGTYAVTLTGINSNGCIATFTDNMFVNDPNNSLHQNPNLNNRSSNSIEYPNGRMNNSVDVSIATTEQKIIVNQQSEGQEMLVQISNMNGQLISSTTTTDSSVTMSVSEAGIYLVTVSTSTGQVQSKKIMVGSH